METYQNLNVALSLQARAFEATLASECNALSCVETAFAIRHWALNRILIFFADFNNNNRNRDISPGGRTSNTNSIESICRVVIPISVMRDEFSPHRRQQAYTVTFIDSLYETLVHEIDLETCWETYADATLWATLSGIHIARGVVKEKEMWFSTQLVKGIRGGKCNKMQLGGRWKWEWSAVKALLRNFYWNEDLVGEEFKVCARPPFENKYVHSDYNATIIIVRQHQNVRIQERSITGTRC